MYSILQKYHDAPFSYVFSQGPDKALTYKLALENGELLNWREFPINHVAIYTGIKSDGYQMLHATSVEGTTVMSIRH